MRIEQLEYFLDVAKTKSLNASAERLFVTQPTISEAIHKLEEELESDLLTRSSKGVESVSYTHLWDTILHTFSGAMLASLGFSVITLLNKTERIPMIMSPSFVAIFTFCFAVTLGVFWEIYEYTADGLLHLNMQNGVPVGHLIIKAAHLAQINGAVKKYRIKNDHPRRNLDLDAMGQKPRQHHGRNA